MPSDQLVLGPLLRHVDQTSASIWVELASPGRVEVAAAGGVWSAHTFTVHGHHYALVEVTGLAAGTKAAYTVHVGGVQVWPAEGDQFPPSRIATIEDEPKLRAAFGSCRKAASHDRKTTKKYGVDTMRAYARHMMESDDKWPDILLMLGDQVYADETSEGIQEFIRSRRDIDKPPGKELRDYEEYAHLYFLTWTDPVIRWLLSTLPTSMIFDDHDVRDDWNTSHSWREEMNTKSWWRLRIKSALASYWVYQHLGNMSPAERSEDEIWQRIVKVNADDPLHDFGALLDDFGDRADQRPDSYRWSYSRDIGRTRVIVVDSRCARVLTPGDRQMLDDDEFSWLDDQLTGDVDHLIVATSLPFLLGAGLHDLEAWDEAVAAGAWTRALKGFGEWTRQTADLEHWGAFEQSFRRLAAAITSVANGERGGTPASIVFLSGDVHNAYLAEVEQGGTGTRILQAVSSPMRNGLPKPQQWAHTFGSSRAGEAVGRALTRSARVRPRPMSWKTNLGPWFVNNIATLEADGRDLSIRWEKATQKRGPGGDSEESTLEPLETFEL